MTNHKIAFLIMKKSSKIKSVIIYTENSSENCYFFLLKEKELHLDR